jgi:phosphatidylglycerophosphatase A
MSATPMPDERPRAGRGGAHWLVATALGAGLSPVAPGTAGSLVGVLVFWPLSALALAAQLAAVVALFALGVYCSGRTAERAGLKDPGIVVVDEVVGQAVALLLLPFTPAVAALSFFLFRVMDVLKPWPARDLEHLPGGLGIMADDVMAGLYANLLVRVVLIALPLA